MKKWVFAVVGVLLAGFLFVEVKNMNSMMTTRQKILKTIYPAFSFLNKLSGKNTTVIEAPPSAVPQQSIYSLKVKLINGEIVSLEAYKGRKLLLVNTASDCGYTPQYDDLQRLNEFMGDKLQIIGFPANDFKEQEKGSNEEIAAFCKKNYGVSFPLATKSSVVKGPGQNEIFDWLSDKHKNGWNNKAPVWNFSKYLISENGKLQYYFDPSVNPMGDEMMQALGVKRS